MKNKQSLKSDVENPTFSNSDRLQYYCRKIRNRLYHDERDIFSLPIIEEKIKEGENGNRTLFGVNEKEWYSLRVIKVSTDMDYTYAVCTSLISFLLLNSAEMIHIDVYHRSSKSKANLHHLGVSCLIYDIESTKITVNDFLFSCFINQLNTGVIAKCWKRILKIVENNGYQIDSWIKSLREIITDYLMSQLKGLNNATNEYLINKYNYSEKRANELTENLFQGCKFHFHESVRRIKNMLNKEDGNIIDQ